MTQEQFLKDQEQDFPKSFVSDEEASTPKSFIADEEKPKEKKKSLTEISKGIFESLTSPLPVHKREGEVEQTFSEKHPQLAALAERTFTGHSPELEQKYKEAGITGEKGQGFQKIPGTDTLAESLRKHGRESGNYAAGFLGSIAGDLVDLIGSGIDPRAVHTRGIEGEEIKPPELKKEVLKSVPEEAPKSPEENIPLGISIRRARNLPPDFAAPGEEDIFNAKRAESVVAPKEQSLFDKATEKFNMGKELQKSIETE